MKSVLITGASSGIGLALAKHYAELGWHVIAGGRSEERLKAIKLHYPQVELLIADLTEEVEVKTSATQLPPLDLMILNAGCCEYIDDALGFDAALFKRVIDNNLISVAYCLEHWLNKVNYGGQLAFTSSSAAFLPLPRAQAYGASKAALTYLAKTLSLDLAQHQIAVSVINPGFVKTPLTDKNTFVMPAIMSCEQAAQVIGNGLAKRQHDINFPFFFTLILKCLNALPFSWWRRFAVKNLTRKQV